MEIVKKLSSEWVSSNEILKKDQAGVETDTDRVKFGDGTKRWSELEYTSYVELFRDSAYVAPENFGSRSDDDTEIIQAALNSGNNVYFSGEEYNVTGTLYVPSDVHIYGNGSVLNVSPEYADSIVDVFSVGTKELNENFDIIKNVIIENLTFDVKGSVPAESAISDDSSNEPPSVFDGGNRCFISIYDNAENVVIENCRFNGAACCVGMYETTVDLCPVQVTTLRRKNIVLRDIWATNVVECLAGETDVTGVYVDNIHIETIPSARNKHAIRFNSDAENIKINNFYIKEINSAPYIENGIFGCPFSFYKSNNGVSVQNSRPIYLSNGEIHAANFGEASKPYEVYADNVNVINDAHYTSMQLHIFEHYGSSISNFNNCTFDNCIGIRSGYYTNCTFILNDCIDFLIDSVGSCADDKEKNRTVLLDCTVDINNAATFIKLDEFGGLAGHIYDVIVKNCRINGNAIDGTCPEGSIVKFGFSTPSLHNIKISDCDFGEKFVTAFVNESSYNLSAILGDMINVEFKRNSFNNGFVLSEGDNTDSLDTVCIFCNAGDELI